MKSSSSKIIVAPSILSADFGNLANEIKSVEKGGADWIHIDVMDGSFVPPITFGENMVSVAKKSTSLPLDTHLMIINPETHFEAFKMAGTDRLTFHVEATKDPLSAIAKIRALNMKSGITLKPATPVSNVEQFLDSVDLVLIMTVNPGWSGQKFLPECLKKIERVRTIIEQRKLPTLVEVDGGINGDTAKLCTNAGAQVIVSGSYIFGAGDRSKAIASLR